MQDLERLFGFILTIFLITTAADAQIRLHFGLKAGVPLTDTLLSSSNASPVGQDFLLNRYNYKTKRLLIGPSLERQPQLKVANQVANYASP